MQNKDKLNIHLLKVSLNNPKTLNLMNKKNKKNLKQKLVEQSRLLPLLEVLLKVTVWTFPK